MFWTGFKVSLSCEGNVQSFPNPMPVNPRLTEVLTFLPSQLYHLSLGNHQPIPTSNPHPQHYDLDSAWGHLTKQLYSFIWCSRCPLSLISEDNCCISVPVSLYPLQLTVLSGLLVKSGLIAVFPSQKIKPLLRQSHSLHHTLQTNNYVTPTPRWILGTARPNGLFFTCELFSQSVSVSHTLQAPTPWPADSDVECSCGQCSPMQSPKLHWPWHEWSSTKIQMLLEASLQGKIQKQPTHISYEWKLRETETASSNLYASLSPMQIDTFTNERNEESYMYCHLWVEGWLISGSQWDQHNLGQYFHIQHPQRTSDIHQKGPSVTQIGKGWHVLSCMHLKWYQAWLQEEYMANFEMLSSEDWLQQSSPRGCLMSEGSPNHILLNVYSPRHPSHPAWTTGRQSMWNLDHLQWGYAATEQLISCWNEAPFPRQYIPTVHQLLDTSVPMDIDQNSMPRDLTAATTENRKGHLSWPCPEISEATDSVWPKSTETNLKSLVAQSSSGQWMVCMGAQEEGRGTKSVFRLVGWWNHTSSTNRFSVLDTKVQYVLAKDMLNLWSLSYWPRTKQVVPEQPPLGTPLKTPSSYDPPHVWKRAYRDIPLCTSCTVRLGTPPCLSKALIDSGSTSDVSLTEFYVEVQRT